MHLLIILVVIIAIVLIVIIPMFMTYHYYYIIESPSPEQFNAIFAEASQFGIISVTRTGELPNIAGNSTNLMTIDAVTRGGHPDRMEKLLTSLGIAYLPVGED
jgi:hypothetical protein